MKVCVPVVLTVQVIRVGIAVPPWFSPKKVRFGCHVTPDSSDNLRNPQNAVPIKGLSSQNKVTCLEDGFVYENRDFIFWRIQRASIPLFPNRLQLVNYLIFTGETSASPSVVVSKPLYTAGEDVVVTLTEPSTSYVIKQVTWFKGIYPITTGK